MEQWRAEFQFWQTEKEEYEEFAQALCLEFQNWRTHQEEQQEYGNQFLQLHFQNLPIDVIRAIKRKVWKSRAGAEGYYHLEPGNCQARQEE